MDGTANLATVPGMGTWVIILLLFLFFMGNNGNFFGGGFGGNNAAWLLNGMNNNNNHDNTVDLINNNTMWGNQLMAQQNLANQSQLISTGFCSVNKSIGDSIYEAQKNTCDIITNANANTQKILDMMCQNQITQLRTDLAEARLVNNNAEQTLTLINQLRPYPVPSFTVSPVEGTISS